MNPSRPTYPILSIEPDRIFLSNNKRFATFQIANSGSGTLEGKISTGCRFVTLSKSNFSLIAGKFTDIGVQLVKNDKLLPGTPVNETITIESNGGTKIVSISFSPSPKIGKSTIWVCIFILIAVFFAYLINPQVLSSKTRARAFSSPPTSTSTPIPPPTSTPILPPTSTRRPTSTIKPTKTPTQTKTHVIASSMLYQEDFEDGKADYWVSMVGTWKIIEEKGNHYWHATGPRNYPQSWLEFDDEKNWTDYAFESRIRLINGPVFVCVRSEDGGNSFYNAAFSTNNWVSLADWDGTVPDNGNNYQTFGKTTYNIQPNKWYVVRVEVQGNDIRLYIDDKLITSGSRDSWSWGGIGYYIEGGETIHIDDIRVWSLK